jgi:hypothetical protein
MRPAPGTACDPHRAPHATRTGHRMPRPNATACAPAEHTSQPKRSQTRRQCTRQRLHTRISDLVVCKPRAAEPDPRPTHRTMRAQCRQEGDPPPHPLTSCDPHCTTCPDRERQHRSPRSHVPLRPSIVKPGGNARASASTPTSPIWLPASREQPSLNHDPAHNARAMSPSKAMRHQKVRTPEPPTTRDPQRSASAETESDSTKAQAARTAETKRRQPRRQCARQPLHTRISD